MAFLPAPVPQVRDYMSHFAAAKNDPFDGNYKSSLAPYLIDVTAPTNAPVPDNAAQQIYSASGDAPTDFLLWM